MHSSLVINTVSEFLKTYTNFESAIDLFDKDTGNLLCGTQKLSCIDIFYDGRWDLLGGT
jgi:hypothetical protein